MKFYFCETCGKRITEQDVEAGQARNKKLKGVFCGDCAVGVMTVETLPLSEDQARKIPNNQNSQQSTTSPPDRKQKPSSIGVVPAARAANAAPGDSRTPAMGEGHRTHVMSWVLAAVAVATVCVYLLLFTKRDDAQANTVAREPAAHSQLKPETDRPATIPNTTAKPVTRKPDIHKTSDVSAVDANSETDGSIVYAEFQARVEKIPTSDMDARIQIAKEFLDDHPHVSEAVRVRSLLEQWKRSSATSPIVEKPAVRKQPAPAPAKPPPVSPLASPAPDQGLEARERFTRFAEEYWRLLCSGDARAATTSLASASRDPGMVALKDEVERERKAMSWLEDVNRAIPKGLERLREEESFELVKTRGEKLRVGKNEPMQVVEIQESSIYVGEKGVSMKLPLADLTPETLQRVAALSLGNDAPGLVRRAFIRLLSLRSTEEKTASDDAVSAIKQAEKAGAPADDVAYLSSKVDLALKGARESAAQELLNQFDKLIADRKWADAELLGNALLERYGDTAAAKRNDLKESIGNARRKGAPIREYELTFQEGTPIAEAGVENYSGTQDTHIYSGNDGKLDSVHSNGDALFIGGLNNFYGLVRFVLLEQEGGILPKDTEIVKARLVMYSTGWKDIPVSLRRVSSPWKAREATWMHASKDVKWKANGGDVDGPVVASSKPGKELACEFDVTESLQAQLKEDRYFGWRFEADVRSHVSLIHSRNTKSPDLRPQLILTVRCTRLPGDKR